MYTGGSFTFDILLEILFTDLFYYIYKNKYLPLTEKKIKGLKQAWECFFLTTELFHKFHYQWIVMQLILHYDCLQSLCCKVFQTSTLYITKLKKVAIQLFIPQVQHI